MDRKHWLRHAQKASALGREVLLKYFGDLSRVREKGRSGLVSEADLAAEKVIQKYLAKHTPEFQFLGEEESYIHHRKGRPAQVRGRWVVDPLDGTTNYVHGFPFFCVSIALEVEGELQVGVVDVPLLNRHYHAIRGGGAFCNGKRIHVSRSSRLEKSLLATGFNTLKTQPLRRQMRIFNRLVRKTRGVRRAGSAAIDLCMVAEGVFDGYWECELNAWDVAAGALLVEEAGGRVTDYSGGRFDIYGKEMLSCNSRLHRALLKEIRGTKKA